MIVQADAIASELYREIKNAVTHLDVPPHVTVFTCAPNLEIKKQLHTIKNKAEEVGIGTNIIEFPDTASTEEMRLSVLHALMQTDGVLVQLPFPSHIQIESILESIPGSYDVAVHGYDGTIDTVLPPCAGAIAEIANRHDLLWASQKVVVIGDGGHVRTQLALWAQKQGAKVSIVTQKSKDTKEQIGNADIVIAAGNTDAITTEMVKDGVVIFDLGTPNTEGVLEPCVHQECAKKASLFTSVPKGIDCIDLPIILRNLVTLASKMQ